VLETTKIHTHLSMTKRAEEAHASDLDEG